MGAGNGRERVQAQLRVVGAARQVIQDAHLVPPRRQVQRRRPPAVPVAACATNRRSHVFLFVCACKTAILPRNLFRRLLAMTALVLYTLPALIHGLFISSEKLCSGVQRPLMTSLPCIIDVKHSSGFTGKRPNRSHMLCFQHGSRSRDPHR